MTKPAVESSRRATEDAADTAYLTRLGDKVRELRARRGMSRKILSRDSGLSERYVAQLEAGQGNISIMLLRQIAKALNTPLEGLVYDGPEASPEFSRAVEFLRQLGPSDVERAYRSLVNSFGSADLALRGQRIALIGLRGAGKSTLGARLAAELGVAFVELDREIEQESGGSLTTLFDFYGQPAFRRLERKCLDKILDKHKKFVLATGGSIVSEPATFERLLGNCFTVWIKASPELHMSRVVAQGDMRPIADNREAMSDLQRILAVRDQFYRRADAQLDTSERSIEDSVAFLKDLVTSGS